MKIKRETDSQLIFERKPWLMSLVLVVMIIASSGMGLLFVSIGFAQGVMLFVFMGALIPIVAIVMCTIAMRLFIRRTQVIFDRATGTITFRTRDMRGYTEVVHDLAHLDHAVLKTSQSRDGDPMSKAVIVLSGGMSAGEHPLTNVSTNGTGPRNAVNAINRWIGKGKDA
ncbi:hypothetical protein [uncultured Tateyamaria sp.]|uniref:hypothetical protein n=1 Tax=Tateyamaria sp. 1078 TaxID=3417464 RepID=UPI002634C8FA|nr:hypothetical protein [uncultured Tateyamaria sp.]